MIWDDSIRDRLGIPEEARARRAVAPPMPKFHFHIWVERGWAGTMSPRLASADAVNLLLRDLIEELGSPDLRGNASFPFTGLFIMVPDAAHPESDQGQSLNVSVRTCEGGRDCRTADDWR